MHSRISDNPQPATLLARSHNRTLHLVLCNHPILFTRTHYLWKILRTHISSMDFGPAERGRQRCIARLNITSCPAGSSKPLMAGPHARRRKPYSIRKHTCTFLCRHRLYSNHYVFLKNTLLYSDRHLTYGYRSFDSATTSIYTGIQHTSRSEKYSSE